MLKTKFYLSLAQTEIVSRPRLLPSLQAVFDVKLTLVSAPAGFGKTILLREWIQSKIETSKESIVWVCLDRNDNDPIRFWSCFIAAIQNAHPHVGKAALATLHSSQCSSFEALLTGLINEIAKLAPFALVLDDFHLIAEPRINRALTFLLDNLPPQMHLIISSRSDPPWPLSRLRARGELLELRVDDLRFTLQETNSFLNQVMKLDLSPENVAALDARTEGWVAGLQMAAISLQKRAADAQAVSRFIQALAASNRSVLDYSMQAVFEQQSPDVQEFLLKTCILEQMTINLCDALTGGNDSQLFLAQLERDNLFLIPLDDKQCWYRYHHLFADLLQNRLQQQAALQITELHHKASQWYEQNGMILQAVGHALAADDVERVAHLVAGNALDMIYCGELTTLIKWLDALPAGVVRSTPWLCVVYAWALAHSGRLNASETLLQAAQVGCSDNVLSDPKEEKRIRGHITAIRAYTAALQGSAGSSIELAREALGYLAESDFKVRGHTMALLVLALRLNGDLDAAIQTATKAVTASQADENLYGAVELLCEMAAIQIAQGQLGKSMATCQKALNLVAEFTQYGEQQMPIMGNIFSLQSVIWYEWNDLDAATHYAKKALKLGRLWGQADISILSNIALARALQASGDPDNALQTIQEAKQISRAFSSWYSAHVDAWAARLCLVQGKMALAVRWMKTSRIRADDEITFQNQLILLTIARILVAQDKIDQVSLLLSRLIKSTEQAGRMGLAIEALILQAGVLQTQGQSKRAISALERALSLAEPEGYIRTFVDLGVPVPKLLGQAEKQGMLTEYTHKLLAAFEICSTSSVGRPGVSRARTMIDPLNQRELEVLRLAVKGLSNKEIADALAIAVSTVAKHLKNIYGKLNVHSRTQAINRARDCKLC